MPAVGSQTVMQDHHVISRGAGSPQNAKNDTLTPWSRFFLLRSLHGASNVMVHVEPTHTTLPLFSSSRMFSHGAHTTIHARRSLLHDCMCLQSCSAHGRVYCATGDEFSSYYT